MGKIKENPRYNVISFRVSDEELAEIKKAVVTTRQALLHNAVMSRVEYINAMKASLEAKTKFQKRLQNYMLGREANQ